MFLAARVGGSLPPRQSGRFPVGAIPGPTAGHTEASFPKAKRTDERLVSVSEHGKFGMHAHSAKIINPDTSDCCIFRRNDLRGDLFMSEIFPETSRMDY